eukprot:12902913-Prorocentrum_lima.AAC.1
MHHPGRSPPSLRQGMRDALRTAATRMASRNLSQDPTAAVRVAAQRVEGLMPQYVEVIPHHFALAVTQLVRAAIAEQEQRAERAAQPPVGQTGPHATGGRDQDLYAAIAAFLGASLETDPQAHVAGLVADTMRRYQD